MPADRGVTGGRGRLDADSFNRELDRLAMASGGTLSVLLVDSAVRMALLGAAQNGDNSASAYLRVLGAYVSTLAETRAGCEPDLCLCCDHELHPKKPALIIVVVVSDRKADVSSESCLVAGVCEACVCRTGWPRSGWEGRLRERIRPVFEQLWPRCRLIAAPEVGGVVGTA